MSKIEDLINKLCPNGIEYKSLNEIFKQFSGMTGVSNKWKETGNCKFIDYMNAYKNLKIDVSRLENATVKKLEQNKLVRGDILLTSASETPDECAISSVIENEIADNVFMDDHLFGIRLKDEYKQYINTTYINYYMHTNSFRKDVYKAVRGVTRFYISVDTFMNIKVAVPPMEVQCEIVHILDDFTLLSAELSAELKARQQQYDYYKDNIWEKVKVYKTEKMSKLCVIGDGLHGTPVYSKDTELWFINGNNLDNGKIVITENTKEVSQEAYNKHFIDIKKGSILLSINGTIGKTAYYNEEKVILGKSVAYFNIIEPDKILKEYLYFYLQSQDALNYYELSKTGSTIKNLGLKALRDMNIPLPSIEKQKEIVEILSRFDKLCNDLTDGLPAEIEARQKQYEYYRDKLLTFKELEVSEVQ